MQFKIRNFIDRLDRNLIPAEETLLLVIESMIKMICRGVQLTGYWII